MINSSRSERGWQGRRRIAVLVSIVGVLGIAALGSTSSASAAAVAGCKAKLEPKGNPRLDQREAQLHLRRGPSAPTVWAGTRGSRATAPQMRALPVRSSPVRESVSASDAVCPIGPLRARRCLAPPDRETHLPPPNAGGSNQTDVPTTCNGFRRVQGAGTGVNGPNLTAIVTPTCTQLIPPGTKVTQSLKLKSSPCSGTTQLYLMVGGEPAVTSFIAAVSTDPDPTKVGPGGDSATVGEYLQAPLPVSMKAYKGCQSSGQGGGGAAKKSGTPPTKYPVSCTGSITPSATPGDRPCRSHAPRTSGRLRCTATSRSICPATSRRDRRCRRQDERRRSAPV